MEATMREIVSFNSAIDHIGKYLANNVTKPFFVAIDNSSEYSNILSNFNAYNIIRVSSFCAKDDSFPDLDSLFNCLSQETRKSFLLGFGEFVNLSGSEWAVSRVKDLALTSKIIILSCGIRKLISDLCDLDKKFYMRQTCFLSSADICRIVKIPAEVNIPALKGFKSLLKSLENSDYPSSLELLLNTNLPLVTVKEINTAFEALAQTEPSFNAHSACLPDVLWAEYIADRNLDNYSLLHWRNFLKLKLSYPKDPYLKLVIGKSSTYDLFKDLIFSALLDVSHKNPNFPSLYANRKQLLKGIKDSEVARYVTLTKSKSNDSIYYLTDNTKLERQSIIESLSGISDLPDLSAIYPALSDYLFDFKFGGKIGSQLTTYFSQYKRLKLTNQIPDEFIAKVNTFALDGNRPYNSLKTRGEVLDCLDKSNATLFWIDALGVEYLGYIQVRAKALGLKITVHTVQANLPTITELNKDFYKSWKGPKMQSKDLHDIKHSINTNYNYETTKLPIHLEEELKIIGDYLEKIASLLKGNKTGKIIIASDHGSSRLAVIYDHECESEMTFRGQHSGRCCPSNEADVKYKYATQENGFWVLANYERFKGGQKAVLEVHGGASLEEVVIPLIEVEVATGNIILINQTPVIQVSYRKKAQVTLFCPTNLIDATARIGSKLYKLEDIGEQNYKIAFVDITKPGSYSADIFEGDSHIGQIDFVAESETSKSNDSDWF
jgi:hypothetical protein